MENEIQPNDPDEMKISRNASFLCKIFQKHGLTAHQKQVIIKRMLEDYKRKQYEEAIT